MSYAQARTYWIPPGDAGIEATVGHMRRLARRGADDDLLHRLAARIVDGSEGPGERARLLRGYLSEVFRFQRDPPGVEWIRTPRELAGKLEADGAASGDCDDVAVLGAALAHVMGLRSRYVLLGFDRGPFSHVYTDVWTGDGWVDLDVTRPDQFPPGLEIKRTGYRDT